MKVVCVVGEMPQLDCPVLLGWGLPLIASHPEWGGKTKCLTATAAIGGSCELLLQPGDLQRLQWQGKNIAAGMEGGRQG